MKAKTITLASLLAVVVLVLGAVWAFRYWPSRQHSGRRIVQGHPAPGKVTGPATRSGQREISPPAPRLSARKPPALTRSELASAAAGDDAALRRPVPSGVQRLAPALTKEKRPFNTRVGTILAMRERLTPEEVTACCEFLKQHEPPAGCTESQWLALNNNVLNLLRRQEEVPAELATTLAEIAADPGVNPVMRDYALQHASTLRGRLMRSGATNDTQKIEEATWVVTEERNGTLAGTALLALGRWDRSGALNVEERTRLAATALDVAADENASQASRVAALHAAARLGLAEAEPLAVAAATGKGAMPLRLTGVNVLGQLGGEKGQAVLIALAGESNTNKLLRAAAEKALTQVGNKGQ